MARIGSYFYLHPSRWLFAVTQQNQEEHVRQWVCYQLVQEYGYPRECLELEYKVKFGSNTGYADIAIRDNSRKVRILIETKARGKSIGEGIKQLQSYLSATVTARYGMATNGKDISCYQKYDGFVGIPDIPSYYELNGIAQPLPSENEITKVSAARVFGPLTAGSAARVKPLAYSDKSILATPLPIIDKISQTLAAFAKKLLLKVAIGLGILFALSFGLIVFALLLPLLLGNTKETEKRIPSQASPASNNAKRQTAQETNRKPAKAETQSNKRGERLAAGHNQSKDRIDNQAGIIDSPSPERTSETPSLGNDNRISEDRIKPQPLGEGDTKVSILSKPRPLYTVEAKDRGVQGTVALSVVLSPSGSVTEIRPLKTLPFGLTEQAVEAAKQLEFIPATRSGRPVPTRITLEYTFSLQ